MKVRITAIAMDSRADYFEQRARIAYSNGEPIAANELRLNAAMLRAGADAIESDEGSQDLIGRQQEKITLLEGEVARLKALLSKGVLL